MSSDRWREQGRFAVESWARLAAQTGCCSDGRLYPINDSNEQMVTTVHSNSGRALDPQHRD